MNTNYTRKLIVACAIALTGIAGAATGAVDQHVHARSTHANGKHSDGRWKADDALQQGMLNIRESVEGSLPRIRAGQFGDEHYEALGKAIETQTAHIVKNCKLEPAADAALHDILGDLSNGIDLITARTVEGQRTHGISYLLVALENYGRRFEHGGWTPVKVVP